MCDVFCRDTKAVVRDAKTGVHDALTGVRDVKSAVGDAKTAAKTAVGDAKTAVHDAKTCLGMGPKAWCRMLIVLVVVPFLVSGFVVWAKHHPKVIVEGPDPLQADPPNFRYNNLGAVTFAPSAEPASCAPSGCSPALCSTASALSKCVRYNSTLSGAYLNAAQRYFDELDPAFPLRFAPYGPKAARFEWPPWLLLTGYPKKGIEIADTIDRKAAPYSVPTRLRNCWTNETAPFARCRVVLWPSHQPLTETMPPQVCTIYEEFTFNAAGEVTFVEAWSDNIPKPPRLSTRIPGLGTSSGEIDTALSNWKVWKPIAVKDADVNAFWIRAQNMITNGVSASLALRMEGGIDKEYLTGCYFDNKVSSIMDGGGAR